MSARKVALTINGRWMAKNLTGTERYASEVTRELLRQPGLDIVLSVPKDAVLPEWVDDTAVVRSRFSGMLYEQVALPIGARRRHVVNLGGPAALFRRNQSVVLFDASVFRYPKTFSKPFVAWYTVLYWVLSRTAKHVFTISQFSAREISTVLRVPESRLVVAECGAEHSLRAIPERPDLVLPEQFALCIGTMAPRKNLVPVARALSDAAIPVVVVGAAGQLKIYAAEGDSDALPGNMIVAGRLTDGEVAWLLDHAAVLVFPSMYEGFGLPVVEAQARGCPVICSDRSSLPEITAGSALLFDPSQPSVVADLVRQVEQDPSLRSTLVERGLTNVKRYTWQKAASVIAGTIVRGAE